MVQRHKINPITGDYMKTQTILFNEFSDNKKEIKITGYAYSMDSDKLLLTIDNDLFTVISITQDDDDRYFLVEQLGNSPIDSFYEEDLFELKIYNKEEYKQETEKWYQFQKDVQYNEYLRLKAIFEPN